MGWPHIIGLGEMMNFPGVIGGDAEDARRDRGDPARGQDGRRALRLARPRPRLPRLCRRAARRTTTRARARRTRSRGSGRGCGRCCGSARAWYDVAAQIKAVTEQRLAPRNFILCTDDCHSGTLVEEGHMDRVVRHAIAAGPRPVTAIQMATLNTAQHFGLERELGAIAPGRRADSSSCTSDLGRCRSRR